MIAYKKDDLILNIEDEKNKLKTLISSLNNLKKNIESCKEKFAQFDSANSNELLKEYLINFDNSSQKAPKTIEIATDLLNELENLESTLVNNKKKKNSKKQRTKSKQQKKDNYINNILSNYNNKCISILATIFSNTAQIQTDLNTAINCYKLVQNIHTKKISNMSTTTNALTVFEKSYKKTDNIETEPLADDTKNEIDNDSVLFPCDENTLLISELKKVVILPFNRLELDYILKTSKEYLTYNEIIDAMYTVPLSFYKNSAISRFKETYKLTQKEPYIVGKGSFSLAKNLFFKKNLHPAIITACKTIDELEIYLNCLENNKLDKFNCFNIKFEAVPTLPK